MENKTAEDLALAIKSLPDEQRQAFIMRDAMNMDYADIAKQLGVSLGKVKTDIFRAREALRKKLQPSRDSVGV